MAITTLIAAAAMACAPVPGADKLWRPEIRWVIVGENHGTAETPAAFANLACLAAASGRKVTVALEQPAEDQPVLDAWLASDGGPRARAALLRTPIWRQHYQDGRSSVAMLRLLDTLRRMKRAGTIAAVRYTDVGANENGDRDATMAAAWRALPVAGDGIVLALTGNVHAMRVPEKRPAFTMVTAASLLPPEQTVTINVMGNGGAAWGCQRDGCGPHANGRPRTAATGIRPQRAEAPWHLVYELGRPTTVSPPAVPAAPVRETITPPVPAPPAAARTR